MAGQRNENIPINSVEKQKKSKLSKAVELFLKVAVTGLCFWYVIKKIDWPSAWKSCQGSNWLLLSLGLALFTASKIIASLRLNIYFRNMHVRLSEKANLRLYWLGMFYNIFLPGGIGGDAYKVIVLKKNYGHSAKLLTAAIFLDRVSGVVGIGILSVAYYFVVFQAASLSLWLLLAILPAMLLCFFIVKKYFPTFINGFWPTFWLGLLVQALQVLCIYCIIASLHIIANSSVYILIFLISSLVAVLPVFFGPFGAREVVFIWGSAQFLLSRDQSICITLLFDLMSIAVSMVGAYWIYYAPLKENTFK